MTRHGGCFCGAGVGTGVGDGAPRPARGPSRRDLLRAVTAAPALAALARPAHAQPRPLPSAPGGPVAIEAGWVLAATADDRLELLRDRVVIVEGGTIAEVRQTRPTGTMARGEPMVLVVKANCRPFRNAPRTTPTTENLSAPGVAQPRNSRAAPSRRTATCWW